MDTLEVLTHNKWKFFLYRMLEFLFSPWRFYKLKYTFIVFPWSEVDRRHVIFILMILGSSGSILNMLLSLCLMHLNKWKCICFCSCLITRQLLYHVHLTLSRLTFSRFLHCLLTATHPEHASGPRRDEPERRPAPSARSQHAFRWDGRWGAPCAPHAEPDERPDAG